MYTIPGTVLLAEELDVYSGIMVHIMQQQQLGQPNSFLAYWLLMRLSVVAQLGLHSYHVSPWEPPLRLMGLSVMASLRHHSCNPLGTPLAATDGQSDVVDPAHYQQLLHNYKETIRMTYLLATQVQRTPVRKMVPG